MQRKIEKIERVTERELSSTRKRGEKREMLQLGREERRRDATTTRKRGEKERCYNSASGLLSPS